MEAVLGELTSAAQHNITGTTLNTTGIAEPSQCVVLQFEDFVPWDNPDSLVSAHTEDLVRRMRDTIVLPLLYLIGGPANVINMAVFYKQGLKERINVCLFSLALADLLYLTNNMLLYAEQIHVQFTTREKYGPIARFFVNNNLLGFYGFTWVSEIISAMIASERCFCILQPLRSQTVLSTSTTTVIVVLVNVVVVGLYFFVTARYRMMCAFDPSTNTNIWTITAGQFYLNNQKTIDFLDAFVYGVGIPLVMIMVVVMTTVVTMIKLRQAAAWRSGTSSSGSVSAREVALTVMLVYNSIFFVICVFPVALFRLVWLFVPEMNAGRRQHNLFFTCIWLMDIVTYINATFNIVVYYTMGSRYRQTFWQLLGRANRNQTTGAKQQATAPATSLRSSAHT
ncbi:uncharacterized protein LOC143295092 [Babylonia areolata]|uniref:uncharacterized protein LOC143295092 n=1 Tax=Babylonia areolata TaxID=304850 RepID=UPI003FCF4A09